VTVAPYRVLFPLGFLFAIVGVSLWPLFALHLIPYPVPLHPILMIQGFVQCFILGFLLTAMPSFLHSSRATGVETGIAAAAMTGFLALNLAGLVPAAEALYVLSLLLLIAMGLRRFRHAQPPPEEFLFVAVGLLLGLAGGVLQGAAAAGILQEPSPRFGLHVISFGMVLSIVLGMGGLLVPTFTSMRDPLVIPGLARPHERAPRRALYATLACLIVAALALEATGRPVAAAWVRAGAGSVALLWVWKLLRLPRTRDLFSYCLWASGWMLLAGLWVPAALPMWSLAGYHVLFIGGLTLLILGIATRVTVRHGGHPSAAEAKVLGIGVAAAVGLSLLGRLGAEMLPRQALPWLGASAGVWILAWLLWGGAAARYLLHVRPASAPVRMAGKAAEIRTAPAPASPPPP
jgi:uncharacterized protein involved in response to NO